MLNYFTHIVYCQTVYILIIIPIQILDVKGTLPHRVCGSRWLPHMKKALSTLFKTYPAFLTQLQNASHENAKAEGLFKLLESYNIVLYAALLQVC